MRLINIKCNDSDSFKYSLLLYIYYYNIKNQLFNLYIPIHFNNNSKINQFEQGNPLIALLIIDVNIKPLFLTRDNSNIKIFIVKL